jgi:short-subunit dehydrogenase
MYKVITGATRELIQEKLNQAAEKGYTLHSMSRDEEGFYAVMVLN